MTPTSKTQHTQTSQILEHLRTRSLSAGEALLLYGTFRLAARVLELRKKGYDIQTVLHTDPRGRRYARYYLEVTDEEGRTGPQARLQERVPAGSRQPDCEEEPREAQHGASRGDARGAREQG